MEEPGRLQSMGSLESDTTEQLPFHFSLSCIGEGNGNPLQCSCLENPRDGKPGGLPSMGSHRVRHDWSNLAAAAASDAVVKNSPVNARDAGLIPGSGRSSRAGNCNPLWYSCLGNPMDKGAWWATVHGVGKGLTRLSGWAHICTHTYSV